MNNNVDKDLSTKEKILGVTLKIIKDQGVDGVTIRKIAKEAEINVALVNYHFGTKDNLINEALKIVIKDIQKLFCILDEVDIEPKKRLKKFLLSYVIAAGENISIIKKAMLDSDKLFQSQMDIITFINEMGIGKIKGLIKEITKVEDEKQLNFTVFQLVGAVFFPIIALPVIEKGGPVKHKVNEDIEGYIDTLINNFFNSY